MIVSILISQQLSTNSKQDRAELFEIENVVPSTKLFLNSLSQILFKPNKIMNTHFTKHKSTTHTQLNRSLNYRSKKICSVYPVLSQEVSSFSLLGVVNLPILIFKLESFNSTFQFCFLLSKVQVKSQQNNVFYHLHRLIKFVKQDLQTILKMLLTQINCKS